MARVRFWRVTRWGKARSAAMVRTVYGTEHEARLTFDQARLNGESCILEHPGPDGWPLSKDAEVSNGATFSFESSNAA